MNLTRAFWNFVRAAELPVPQPTSFLTGLHPGDMDPHPVLSTSQKLDMMSGWVYAAVDAICKDVSSAEWKLYRNDLEVMKPPILQRPNALMSFEGVMETTQLHLDLAGEAFWNLIRDDPSSNAIGFQVVYPHWVTRARVEGGKLVGWEIAVPGFQGAAGRLIPAADMVFFRYPHPKEVLRGMSPVEGYATSQKLDLNTRAYAGALMSNNAVPALLISTDQDVSPEQAEDMQARWVERYANRPGEPAVLGRGAKAQLLGLSLEKLGIDVIDRITRDQIFGTYGVPASKKGLVEDVNRANADSNERTYQKNVILPRLKRLAKGVNQYLLPEIGLVGHEIRYESPVMEDMDFLLEKATKVVMSGMALVNDGREMLGMERTADGDVYLVPVNVVRVPVGELDVPPPDEPRQVTRQTHLMESDEFELVEERFKRESDRLERWMVGQCRRVFGLEQKEVVKAVREGWDDLERGWKKSVLDGSMTWFGNWFAKGPVGVGLAKVSEEWQKVFYQASTDGARAGWQLVGKQIKERVDWDQLSVAADTRAKRWAATRITEVSRTTQKEVRKIIREALREGRSVESVAEELARKYDQFKGARSRTIARTEMTSNINWGSYKTATETVKKTGIALTKTWVTILDGHERETHRRAHGQTVGSDEVFQVGAASLRWPGDNAPAAETINCRCTMSWRKQRASKTPGS